jgi:18S rRNA (adenine1779-N6/adenine1780-N6)-dimethyltransferase
MQQFKAKLMAILEKTGYADKRSSKLGLDDYLKMLFAFNQAGIHFR